MSRQQRLAGSSPGSPGSRGSGKRRARTRLRAAGPEDVPVSAPDDGSALLEAFLANGNYQRVAAKDLCGPGAANVEAMDLTVFLHKDGVWRTLKDDEVLKVWDTAQITHQSFCRILKKNLFKLRGPQKASLARSLQHASSADSIGFYRGDGNKYALVVRLPVDFKTSQRNAMLAGFAVGTSGVAVAHRNKREADEDDFGDRILNPQSRTIPGRIVDSYGGAYLGEIQENLQSVHRSYGKPKTE